MGLMSRIRRREQKKNKSTAALQGTGGSGTTPASMRALLASLKREHKPADLVIRKLKLGNREAALILFDGLVDKKIVGDHLLRPLLLNQTI